MRVVTEFLAPVARLGWLLPLALAVACSTPPTASTLCKQDSCDKGYECVQGQCVEKTKFPCEATQYCKDLYAAGEWKPATKPDDVCMEARCELKLCAVVPKADGMTCAPNSDVKPLECEEFQCKVGICEQMFNVEGSAAVKDNYCLIDENGAKSCKQLAEAHPTNECLVCDPNQDKNAWSAKAKGEKCLTDNDKLDCTPGACDGKGACKPSGEVAKDFCNIDNQCVGKGAVKDKSPCEVCDPDQSQTAWSPKADGEACEDGDGKTCTVSKCAAGKCEADGLAADTCLIPDVGCRNKDDTGLACQVCDPAKDPKAWTLVADRCLIDGKCVVGGQADGEDCAFCDPSDPAKWTWKAADSACGKWGECRSGACNQAGQCIKADLKPGYCLISADGSETCVKEGGLNPENDCLACDPKLAPQDWSFLPKDATCTADEAACTVDACDGKGACLNTPVDALCQNLTTACAVGVCDKTAGCKAQSQPQSVACEGDNVACTKEFCDGKGVCPSTGTPADADCDDKASCTDDACTATGCTHTPVAAKCDDGNACTEDTCKPADVGANSAGCTFAQLTATACPDDNVQCTTDTCKDGACNHALADNTCLIGGKDCVAAQAKAPGTDCLTCDPSQQAYEWTLAAETCLVEGTCKAKGDESAGGCMVCEPGSNAKGWTARAKGTACTNGDAVTCTDEACDAGVCKSTAVDGHCTSAPSCTVDRCKPGAAGADAATGCLSTDNCAFGHKCEPTANACLSYDATAKSYKPVVVVTGGGANPNPTNPALVRHEVTDAQTGVKIERTWLVFQSDTCADSSGGTWKISKPAALRAVALDPQEADGKAAPGVVTLAQSSVWGGGASVCQGFPTVVSDPLSKERAWVSWLEADVTPNAPGACLTSQGQGGVLRIGRLDGGVVQPGGNWGAVAGTKCSADDTLGPLVLTQALGLLDAVGVDAADPAKRGVISVRPEGTTLAKWTSALLARIGLIDGASALGSLGAANPFSQVHPVLVDTGVKSNKADARYYSVALTEKTSAQTRQLWAVPMDSEGADDTAQTWLAGANGAASTGTDFNGISAVCSLDATVEPTSGDIAVVMVVRRGSEDQVLLGVKKGANAMTVGVVAKQASFGVACGTGLSTARVGVVGSQYMVAWLDSNGPTSTGAVYTTKVPGPQLGIAAKVPLLIAADKDGSGPSQLAWRGLSRPTASAEGTVTLAVETGTGVSLYTFKP